MHAARSTLALLALLVIVLGTRAAAADPQADADEQIMTADGPALVEFFRKRSTPPDLGELRSLVRQLEDPSPAAREKATADLIALGPAAVPVLRQAASAGEDGEAARRARRCLQVIPGPALPTAAARRLARRPAPGAAAALLAYLPFADDGALLGEVQAALAAVAFRDDVADPALVRALDDPSPLRRTVAAEVLVRPFAAGYWPAAAHLLRDPSQMVRLRAAVALAGVRYGDAFPVLIDLLADLPAAQAAQAEERLAALAGDQGPKPPSSADAEARRKWRDAWAAWWKGNEGVTLLETFRRQTPSDANRARAQALIRQLRDDSFEAREQASADLAAMGQAALPLLQQARSDADLEVRQRVRRCLDQIQFAGRPAALAVVARLLAVRKPDGAAEALLAFLPHAQDENLTQEMQEALTFLAVRDGKPESVVLRALEDAEPRRRAAAAEALCRAGAPGRRDAVRRLLQDPEPAVRLRAVLALGGDGDRDAVPVLIALVGELPPGQASPAEDFLFHLAGGQSPAPPLAGDAQARTRYRDAWAAWWRERGAGVTLARLDAEARTLGLTLIAEMDFENTGVGRAYELDAAGRVRWLIDKLEHPVDVRLLPGDRVLIAELEADRISERDVNGKVLWEKEQNGAPVNVQRLPGGNTFLASRQELREVDPLGKDVAVLRRGKNDIRAALRLRNGQTVLVTIAGQCVRLDGAGNEMASFPVGRVNWGCLDVLPDGRVLVAQAGKGKVVEFDAEGKPVWEVAVAAATFATRLPNGHTLVTCASPPRVVELNRAGAVVWEHKTEFPPTVARRR